jgi:hypothetical protein
MGTCLAYRAASFYDFVVFEAQAGDNYFPVPK